MLIRRVDTSKIEPSVGGTTKRIVVFLFGTIFAAVAIVAAFVESYLVAIVLSLPAIIFFAIALWGQRRSLRAAHDAASVMRDIAHLP